MKNTLSIILAALGLTLLAAGCGDIKVGDGIGADGNHGGRIDPVQIQAAQNAMCPNGRTLRQDPMTANGTFADLGAAENDSRLFVITFGNDPTCAFVDTKKGTILQGANNESVSYIFSAGQACFPQGSLWYGNATFNGTMMQFNLVRQDPAGEGVGGLKATLVVSQDFSLVNAFTNFGFNVLSCQ